MRGTIAATVTGAALVVSMGPGAMAADTVDIVLPDDVASVSVGQEIVDYEVTDDAIYTATRYVQPNGSVELPSGGDGVRIWQRDLHPTADGVAVGNARLVGTAVSGDWDNGFDAVANGIVFADADLGGRLVALADDGTKTTLWADDAAQPVESTSTDWYTSVDMLWPIDEDGLGSELLTGLGSDLGTLPWPVNDTTSTTVVSRVSATAVVWQEKYRHNGTDDTVYRTFAHRLDAEGLVGDPVLLAQRAGNDIDGFQPEAVAVSDTVVAWTEIDYDADEVFVAWVPVSDLTATPTIVTNAYAPDLDGSRLAYATWTEQTTGVMVVDTATDAELASWTVSDVTSVDIHGDLVVIDRFGGSGDEALQVRSISGDTDVAAVPQFDDIAMNPFAAAIDQVAAAGVTTGYADGTFRPTASVNRDAMAAFLYRQAGSPAFTAPAASPFVDVPTSHPFYREICWLAAEGISTGWTTPVGAEYRPGEPVSREAMAAFLYRFAGEPTVTGDQEDFIDVPAGHPFATAIDWMAEAGISTGWDTPAGRQFRPGASIERQAMAAFLVRYQAADR